MVSLFPHHHRRVFIWGTIALAVIYWSYPGACQGLAVTTSTAVGVILGEAREFVYNGNGSVLSELDWPLLPACCLGANINFSIRVGFFASGQLQVGLIGPSYVNAEP